MMVEVEVVVEFLSVCWKVPVEVVLAPDHPRNQVGTVLGDHESLSKAEHVQGPAQPRLLAIGSQTR